MAPKRKAYSKMAEQYWMNSERHIKSTQNSRKRQRVSEKDSTVTVRHTRSMTRQAAINAVFNTNELLEHILGYLSPKDVGIVQGVCSAWEQQITTSVTLRKARTIQPDWFIHPTLAGTAPAAARQLFLENPVLHYLSYESFKLKINSDIKTTAGTICSITGWQSAWTFWDIGSLGKGAYTVEDAKTYMTLPPVPVMWLQVVKTTRELQARGLVGDIFTECTIRVPTGVTVGDLVSARDDLLKSVIKKPKAVVRCFARFDPGRVSKEVYDALMKTPITQRRRIQ